MRGQKAEDRRLKSDCSPATSSEQVEHREIQRAAGSKDKNTEVGARNG